MSRWKSILLNKIYCMNFSRDLEQHTTETCLTHLCDYIRQNFDEGNHVGMILLDLQKAFDTVNHAILLSKLQSIGFRNSAVKWFTSYLTGRT